MKVSGMIFFKSIRKTVAIMLASAMIFTLCGCNAEQTVSNSGERLSYRWIDSNLFENVDQMADADLKDDYAAAINSEWASHQVRDLTFRISAFGEVEKKVLQNKIEMLRDGSVQGKNIEVVRTAYDLFCDWEYRDSLGVEPLKKYLDYIDGINTLDDVSSYMIDNEKNPFAFSLVELDNASYIFSGDRQALVVSAPDPVLGKTDHYVCLTDDAFKEKEKVETRIKYLLGRCGYQENEIRKILEGCFRFESKLVELDGLAETVDYYDLITRDEILNMAGKYPLKEMLEHYGITECDAFSGFFTYVDNLESVYTPGNVEDMKAYFKVRLALKSIHYLDRGAYDCFMDSNVDRTNSFAERSKRDGEWAFFYLARESSLTAAVDQVYLDYYFDQTAYDEIKAMISDIKDQYRILINANENLSDESKKAVLEKLDRMGENVILPSNKADFSDIELKPKEEGGSYLDALCKLSKKQYEHVGEMVQSKTGRSYWDIYNGSVSTTSTGSNYYIGQNTVYIQIGILEEPLYSPDAPVEQKLATFGSIVGHEISHAFDSKNISLDADNHPTGVITENELNNWSVMEDRIINHLSTFEAFDGSGKYDQLSNITGEVIADIEGVKVCLMIAGRYPDFDYDVFFREYAVHWRSLTSKQEQMDAIKNDTHPLMYMRINYILMQFEEFDVTYGIEPGDGMYLAPEQRVFVW